MRVRRTVERENGFVTCRPDHRAVPLGSGTFQTSIDQCLDLLIQHAHHVGGDVLLKYSRSTGVVFQVEVDDGLDYRLGRARHGRKIPQSMMREGSAKSPNEQVQKNRLKELLTKK